MKAGICAAQIIWCVISFYRQSLTRALESNIILVLNIMQDERRGVIVKHFNIVTFCIASVATQSLCSSNC